MNKQPILTQLYPKFNAPIVAESHVQSLNDLLSLTYNYPHKLVWVIDENSFYYLEGDGTELFHWKKQKSDLNLEAYLPNKEYKAGQLVFHNSVIYQAKENVPINTLPNKNPHKWVIVTGKLQFGIYIFEKSDTFTIVLDVNKFELLNKRPEFTIYTGELVKNSSGGVEFDSDGLLQLKNMEIVEAEIEKISNTEYRFSFYEDNKPIKLSGYVTYQ